MQIFFEWEVKADWAKAVKRYKTDVATRYKTDIHTNTNTHNAQEVKADYAKAEKHYRTALLADPDHIETLSHLGTYLGKTHQVRE